jgi:hypothetical protein
LVEIAKIAVDCNRKKNDRQFAVNCKWEKLLTAADWQYPLETAGDDARHRDRIRGKGPNRDRIGKKHCRSGANEVSRVMVAPTIAAALDGPRQTVVGVVGTIDKSVDSSQEIQRAKS